jgi:hypothetical protein
MKISNKLMLAGAMYALAAGIAHAQTPEPVLEDSQGRAVLDGSGNCVLTSGRVLPECGPAPAPAKPAAPAQPAAPAAPAPAPAPAPAKPAPSSVRQAIVIQADALFDFDKSVVRSRPSARASPSRSRPTRPRKAARRTAAWTSSSRARSSKPPRLGKEPRFGGAFCLCWYPEPCIQLIWSYMPLT